MDKKRKINLRLLALAIARQEGWFSKVTAPLSIPHRCNNPGNLRWAPLRFKQEGFYGRPGNQYIIFQDRFWGGAALLNDLRAKYLRSKIDGSSLTIKELINIYCPAGDGANDPFTYVNNISRWLGVDPEYTIRNVFEDPGIIKGPWNTFPEPGPHKSFSK